MAPSPRSSTIHATIFPIPTLRTQPAPASVTIATAMSIGSHPESIATAPSPSTTSLRRNAPKTATVVSSPATRKRTRQDTLDENASNDTRKARVRQRLSSMSSMETIRADPGEQISDVEKKVPHSIISRTSSCSSMGTVTSEECLSPRPLAEANRGSPGRHEPATQAGRTLRRVGTIVFPPKSGQTSPSQEAAFEVGDELSTKYTSRIPLPTRRSSSMSLL